MNYPRGPLRRWRSSWGTALEAMDRHGGQQDGGRIPTGAADVEVDQSNDEFYQAPSPMPGFGYNRFVHSCCLEMDSWTENLL
jgi:hypothetical protein